MSELDTPQGGGCQCANNQKGGEGSDDDTEVLEKKMGELFKTAAIKLQQGGDDDDDTSDFGDMEGGAGVGFMAVNKVKKDLGLNKDRETMLKSSKKLWEIYNKIKKQVGADAIKNMSVDELAAKLKKEFVKE